MNELKPCPFYHTHDYRGRTVIDFVDDCFYVFCIECDARGPSSDFVNQYSGTEERIKKRQQAVDRWNKRNA